MGVGALSRFILSYSLENKNKNFFFLIPLNNNNNNNNNNNSKTFGDRGLVRAQIVLIIQKFQKF